MNYLHKRSILIYFVKSITSLILILFCFQISSFSQEKKDYISFSYIIKKLTSTSRLKISNEDLNNKIIVEIKEQKVDFILNEEDEKLIKEAKGSDSLIKAIRGNLPKKIEEKLKFYEKFGNQYEKFLANRRGPSLEQYETALQTGKQLIEWYDDDKRIKEEYREEFREYFKEIIEYVKKQIIRIKAAIECYI